MTMVVSNPPQLWDDPDGPRARKSDPLTSHLAADSNNPAASRQFVMDCLHKRGPLAQFELEELAQGLWSPSRVRTAVSELVTRDLVEFTGLHRLTPSGRSARVWSVLP